MPRLNGTFQHFFELGLHGRNPLGSMSARFVVSPTIVADMIQSDVGIAATVAGGSLAFFCSLSSPWLPCRWLRGRFAVRCSGV